MSYPEYPDRPGPSVAEARALADDVNAEAPSLAAAAEPSVRALRYATLDDLLRPNDPAPSTREEDYEMDSGLVVRIRPLTRAEVLKINGMKGLDTAARESHYLSRALVEPRMTPDNVAAWQARGLAGDIGELVERVQHISGLDPKGEKAAAKEFPRSGI